MSIRTRWCVVVGSFKQHSRRTTLLRANRTRMKQKGMNEWKKERERIGCPDFLQQNNAERRRKTTTTKYTEKTIWKQNKRLFLFVPSRSPRPFRIGPFQTLLYYSCFIRSSIIIIKSQNTNKICVQFDEWFRERKELFEEFGVKKRAEKRKKIRDTKRAEKSSLF